jgi:phage tail sheath protein FI
MSFLRKTALRAGVDYVFEPNGDEFRRGVQRGFETLLDSLLLRGAFAGRTARDSYKVVTDSSLNTQQAMDNGQFFVELRVAPSVPMRFLTIRLLQTADRTYVTEGG